VKEIGHFGDLIHRRRVIVMTALCKNHFICPHYPQDGTNEARRPSLPALIPRHPDPVTFT